MLYLKKITVEIFHNVFFSFFKTQSINSSIKEIHSENVVYSQFISVPPLSFSVETEASIIFMTYCRGRTRVM